MLAPLTVLLAGLAWVGLLFGVALYGERHERRFARVWPVVYSLSLAVHCTAWTFYGTVTQAMRWDVWLPPTFVGIMALVALGVPFLARLARVAREQNSASLADLVAARFGKDSTLAAVITAVALLGMIPYVALQLKAVAQSYAVLTRGASAPAWQDAALWVAVLMAAFAMLFGTRRAAATEHSPGLVLAVSFASVIKLGAMLAVGVFAVWGAAGGIAPLAAHAATLPPRSVDGTYFTLIGLGAVAMFTVPHQFHVGTVELNDPRHLRTARWLFPLYLVVIGLPMLPIALAGHYVLPVGVPTDLYVLALPLEAGRSDVSLLSFLGGLSSATGMVILAALTLSIMVAQHWIAPTLVRGAALAGGSADLRPAVLAHRRIGIALVLALSWLYSRAMASSDTLADIGVLSLSALIQLAPAVIAAVYAWPVSARALSTGIVAGTAAWIWLLLVPAAQQAGVLELPTLPPPLHWLLPDSFLGLGGWQRLPRGVIASLAVNLATLAWFLGSRPARVGRVASPITVAALRDLSGRFLTAHQADALFAATEPGQPAPPAMVDAAQRELAAVIGTASARLLVDAARRGEGAPLATVAEVVGETSQALRFNQQLLEAALENMSQGISVVDKELRLVAWNRRYEALFGYPPGLLRVGVEITELLRHNAGRGLLGAGEREALVQRRLERMRAGTPYVAERRFPDGTVVEIRGNPMPGGGFVATFTDVTAFRHAEHELKQVAETLEQRVGERTAQLEQAKGEAERANSAKSRFLAAVSHDLLQPINAAHLFNHALAQRLRHPQYREAIANIDGALGSAESLLAALLDISRLDAGGMSANVRNFCVDDLLQHLAAEFRVLAAERGLQLECVPSRAWVRSDPQLLRRVLQNFLSNAVRYTLRGRILLGCRRRGAELALEVWDTGPGIAGGDQQVIFEEFRRLDRGGQGLGLGLAIAERIARLLGHRLTLVSQLGRGTGFGIVVPRAAAEAAPLSRPRDAVPRAPRSRVLLVDNDPAVLKAMQALLDGWHCDVLAARTAAEAERAVLQHAPDLMLLDYHLDGGETGLALYRRLSPRFDRIPGVIITADHSEAVRAEIAAEGCHLLHKPLKPLALKSLMARLLAARRHDAA